MIDWSSIAALGSVFAISFLSSIVLYIPLPYLLTVFFLGTQFNPAIVGLISALGATLGKVVVYFIGRASRLALSEERLKKLEFAKLIADRYGPISIFILAASPLPDDALYVPLGIVGYSLPNFFVFCLLGKIVLACTVAYAGFYSITWIGDILGMESPWGKIAVLIFIIASVYITFKVDWEKLFLRYFKVGGGRA